MARLAWRFAPHISAVAAAAWEVVAAEAAVVVSAVMAAVVAATEKILITFSFYIFQPNFQPKLH